MVLINNTDVISKLYSYNPTNRMPLLCAVYRSFGRRIISENNEYEKCIRSEVFDINDGGGNENYLTSIALSEDGIVAVGSGNKEGYLYFIKDRSAVKDIASGARFKPLHREMIGSPIYSLDWSGDKLLVGSNNGAANLYTVDFDEDILKEFTLVGRYVNSPSTIRMHAPFYISNTHVKSVEFAPNYDISLPAEKNRFLSTTLNQISVWDQSNTNEPLYKIQSDESPLQCASWSPNEPHSMIVYGGYDRNLCIVDTRVEKHQSVVWRVENAHDRPITDAKFNMFIPYWLASAGEDSIVNIWDIRASYHAPVAKIDGNVGVVTSVVWSNIRPENLATTASDGTMRFWSLYPENFPLWDTVARISNYSHQDTLPIALGRRHSNIWCAKQQNYSNIESNAWTNIWDDEDEKTEPKATMLLVGSMGIGSWGRLETGFIYKGEQVIKPKGSSVAVKASKLRPSAGYSILDGGQLVSHTIRFDAASNLRYRHRFDPKDKDVFAAEIEDDIYCRRITKAHEKLDKLKFEIKKDQHEERYRQEAVTFLEDCLRLRDPIKESDWSIDSIPDKSNNRRLWNDEEMWEHAISLFKNDLQYWSYRIPPGYKTQVKFPYDFSNPIIAEHLIETEKLVTELPPLLERSDEFECSADHPSNETIHLDLEGIEKTDNKDNIIPSDTKLEDSSTVDMSKRNHTTVTHRFELMDDDELVKSSPIKDRRKMSHIPAIVTVQSEGDSSLKNLNLATPPYSASGTHQNAEYSSNPFEINTENAAGHSPTSISSLHITPMSKTSFEQSNHTNPFEISYIQAADNATPLEATNSESEPLSNNPIEINGDNNTSIKSLEQPYDHSLRRKSWISNKLGLSTTIHTDEGHQDCTASQKSLKKRHKFNVFKRFTKNNRNKNEDPQLRQEERIENMLQRKSSNRRNAMHGPF